MTPHGRVYDLSAVPVSFALRTQPNNSLPLDLLIGVSDESEPVAGIVGPVSIRGLASVPMNSSITRRTGLRNALRTLISSLTSLEGKPLLARGAFLGPNGAILSVTAWDIVSKTPAGFRGFFYMAQPDAARLEAIAEQLICAELITVAPFKLVDLRGDRLLQIGVPTDAVRASSHRLGQNWSLTFWSHQEQPDGIIYPSRLNQETNLALYNRALAKIELSAVRPFLEYRADVAALIREFKIAIV